MLGVVITLAGLTVAGLRQGSERWPLAFGGPASLQPSSRAKLASGCGIQGYAKMLSCKACAGCDPFASRNARACHLDRR
jgi:hypothetical protein